MKTLWLLTVSFLVITVSPSFAISAAEAGGGALSGSFPSRESQAGLHVFPLLIPSESGLAGIFLAGKPENHIFAVEKDTRRDIPKTVQVEAKSLVTAGLLGGLLGFGSGQYYSEGWISGSVFLAIDITALAITGYGIATLSKDDDEDALGNAFVGSLALTYGGIPLLASHAVQVVLGPIWADHFNDKIVEEGRNKIKAFITPEDNSIMLGLTWSF